MTITAQDTIPHVKGDIRISVKKGTIECDIILSNMPQLKDYFFRLNSGMNIRYIKNAEPAMMSLPYEKSLEDKLASGESAAYFIPAYNEYGKYLPKTIRFNYVGMYPVITDSSSAVDWRGNIAFNGQSLRADGIQSAWFPILYDIKTDTRYEKVTYDLNINCEDCEVIYMNGSQPVSGTQAKLISNKLQDLTMFVGNFNVVSIDGDFFLNSDTDIQQLIALNKTLHSFQSYLEHELTIPYNGKTTYIQTTPVSKNNSWLFASYPSIVKVGWDDGMKSFANREKGAGFLQYMAHELAHYYFGTVRTFNSELGDMISEGFAEFLSLQITHKFISDSLYQKVLESKVRSLRNLNATAIKKIQSKNDYKNRELYVYYYAPLLFLAIQKEIGEDKMREWMKSLLLSPTVFTDYTFFEQTLKNTLHDQIKFNLLFEKYFNSDNSFLNILSTLNIQSDGLQTSNSGKQVTKTYYYFFFSRPILDIGSTQNKMIVHTEIGKVTCTDEELFKLRNQIASRVKEACKNDSGSTLDFNTYDTLEMAQLGLKRWLERYNKYSNVYIEKMKL